MSNADWVNKWIAGQNKAESKLRSLQTQLREAAQVTWIVRVPW